MRRHDDLLPPRRRTIISGPALAQAASGAPATATNNALASAAAPMPRRLLMQLSLYDHRLARAKTSAIAGSLHRLGKLLRRRLALLSHQFLSWRPQSLRPRRPKSLSSLMLRHLLARRLFPRLSGTKSQSPASTTGGPGLRDQLGECPNTTTPG